MHSLQQISDLLTMWVTYATNSTTVYSITLLTIQYLHDKHTNYIEQTTYARNSNKEKILC